MTVLYMVGFFRGGGYVPLAFFVRRSDANSFLDALRATESVLNATIEEVSANMFGMAP